MIISKKIAIFGFGKEGLAAANFLGNNNHISIIDDKLQSEIDQEIFKKLKSKNVNFSFGKNFPKDEKFDLLIRSPGFRPDHPKIAHFTRQGIFLTSPTNIFFENYKGLTIGVTGTKGKGTTATLIYEFLKTQFENIFLAGNIGLPPLEIFPHLKKQSIVVLELSSFQLMDLKYSPHIAIVLMVTSDHLDWHKNQNKYIKTKESIIKFQSSKDYAVINSDFKTSLKYASKTKAKVYYFSTVGMTNSVYMKDAFIYSQIGKLQKICKTSSVLLPGKHNLQNVCAATAVAQILQIKKNNIQKVLTRFKGLKHRLQLVRQIKGISYYNDSYSTIPATTIAAIEAFDNPKILILGGSSKNSDFDNLGEKIIQNSSIKALILIGRESSRIKKTLNLHGNFKGQIIENLKAMGQIVKKASEIANYGDVILLSPACASFDMFKNYEDRGQQFLDAVNKL